MSSSAEPSTEISPAALHDAAPPRLDRWFYLAILLAALVILPRSILIARAHSPVADTEYHLARGYFYLTHDPAERRVIPNDGPLGQALTALPLLPLGLHPDPPAPDREATPFPSALASDRAFLLIAVWKSLLFLPAAALAFHWSRQLYGLTSAWLALALLLVDPTFAAHIPLTTVDVLGVEAILFACYLAWCYTLSPTRPRLLAASVAIAVALMTKQNAVAVPAVFVGYVLVNWVLRPRRATPTPPPSNNLVLRRITTAALLTLLCVWALTIFDISRPADRLQDNWAATAPRVREAVLPVLQHRWPAGAYVATLAATWNHNHVGALTFLNGQLQWRGFPHYYPAVATYKIPLGHALILLLALLSLTWRRPRWDELSLLLPLILLIALLQWSNTQVGFRHALPAYLFALMLASRCVARERIADCRLPIADSSRAADGEPRNDTGAASAATDPATQPSRTGSQSAIGNPKSAISTLPTLLASLALLASLLHTLTYHPDYLSYTNRPLPKPWLHINDSDIDWGQAVKQIRLWVDTHVPPDRPVHVRYAFTPPAYAARLLGDRVHLLSPTDPVPTTGLLILSPGVEAGLLGPYDRYAPFRMLTPLAIIGHAVPVYDLDHPIPQR
jgi:hypothetical protein